MSALASGAPLEEPHLASLARAELDQVRYWRPRSIGELVFQHWD